MATNIFEHIKKEHREVEQMLQKLSGGFDRPTFDKLNLSLQAHMKAEEGSLYPAMEGEAGDMVKHAQEEHDEVRQMLKRLEGGSGADASKIISEMTQAIQDHVQEEENEMFPKAQGMFDQGTIRELSEKFEEIDERIMQRAK